ncbi:helix-turn-helix domain-containing protein, partial [Thiorhodospira sibirica]|uniref:helix-turn-helix domain-containing protein n=1 Tax=Thiorhodospira sibirica TaxID=154347 RepID=UPI001C8E37F0
MKKDDARTLHPAAQEEKRKTAVRLSESGLSQREIAEQLGVHYQTVGRWLAKYRAGGVESLLRQQRGRRLGSGRQLAPDEEADLQALLREHTPDQLEMPYALWSREAVQELIRQETGLRMPIRSVGEYLKRGDSQCKRQRN